MSCVCFVKQDRLPGGRNGVVLEEHVDDLALALGVIEEHKQRPVDQPGALLQLNHSRAKVLQKRQ